MTVFALLSLLLYLALAAPALLLARLRGGLFWSDLAAPVLILALWILLTALGYGHQSLSHIVELPIALLFGLLLTYARVFLPGLRRANARRHSYAVLGLSLLGVVLLRTFMPYLPE